MEIATEQNTHVGTVLFDEDRRRKYLVLAVNENSYTCLDGLAFEPIGIGKKWIRYYYNTGDDKDLSALRKLMDVKGGNNMDNRAIEIVTEYIKEHLDKSDEMPFFEVFTVWKAKILQNWKYLLSSTLFDGMYYELTYNGDKREWYLDAYKKFENRVIKES